MKNYNEKDHNNIEEFPEITYEKLKEMSNSFNLSFDTILNSLNNTEDSSINKLENTGISQDLVVNEKLNKIMLDQNAASFTLLKEIKQVTSKQETEDYANTSEELFAECLAFAIKSKSDILDSIKESKQSSNPTLSIPVVPKQ